MSVTQPDDMQKRSVACVHVYSLDKHAMVKMAIIFMGFFDETGGDGGPKVGSRNYHVICE